MDSSNSLKMLHIINKYAIIHESHKMIFIGYIDNANVWSDYTIMQFETEEELNDYVKANSIEFPDVV